MKGRLLLSLAVACALGGLGVSYWALFARPEGRAEPARAIAPETLRLTAASGVVEVAAADGKWRPAKVGATLSEHDRIRTDAEGSAALLAADGSTVRLSGGSEAEVAALRRELKRLHLGAGMVEADVPADPTRVFQIDLDRAGGAARTRGAHFTATANSSGTAVAAVAAVSGEVILSARGKEVVIRAGQWARILPGAPPETPGPIPDSLFLKVAWPATASRSHAVAVSGQTTAGARVRVGGRWVEVDRDGVYRAQLELADGVHQLAVHAVDVSGHTADEKGPKILVDTRTDFKIHPPKWK